MNAQPHTPYPAKTPFEHPEAALEMAFIEEFLVEKGTHYWEIHKLSEEAFRTLMIGASIHASNKLAVIEKRSRLIHELHGLW